MLDFLPALRAVQNILMKIGPKDCALVIVSIVVTILVAEGIAQLFLEPTPRFITGFRLNASSYYMEDDELGWVPRPNMRGEHNQPGSFQSAFSTNSMGLRDDELSSESRSRPTRIVALGDSFTWGFGVNDDEIYTSVIEESSPNIEVVNLGVTAYGLRQETDYFERIGRSMNPDITLLALVMNDIADTWRRLPGETAQEWKSRIGFRTLSVEEQAADQSRSNSGWSLGQIKPWLSSHSVLYRSLIDVINTNKTLVNLLVALRIKGAPADFEGLDPNLRPYLIDYPASVLASIEQTKQELTNLRDIVQQSGSRLLVVVVPALQSVDPRARRNSIAYTRYYEEDFDLDKPYRWLQEYGETAGIAVLNTYEVFRAAHEEGAVLYLPNDMHFNAAGHRLFADEILRFLVDHDWTQ